MSALTDADLALLGVELGDIDETLADDLQERYDRLGSLPRVALEVLRLRLARLLSKPASFTLTGVMSKDTSANIRALQTQVDRLAATVAAESVTPEPARTQGHLVRSDRGR